MTVSDRFEQADNVAIAVAPRGALATPSRRTRLRHITRYRYDRPILLGPHTIRLRPASEAGGRVIDYYLRVTPTPLSLRWHLDPHGNWAGRLLFAGRTTEFELSTDLTVDATPTNPFDFLVEPSAESWPFSYEPSLAIELGNSAAPSGGAGFAMAGLLAECRALGSGGAVEFLGAVNRMVHERVEYVVRQEGEVQSPAETLRLGYGSCRDSAWLLVELFRHLGLAARFVSGYLVAPFSPAVRDVDESGLHAWAHVYLPGAGWVGFDPVTGLACAEDYLPLASVVHYANAAPVTGTTEEAVVEASFEFRTSRAR
jgi:transglutaminase-like putative cysteine protease